MNNRVLVEFGQRLRILRESKGLSQAQLAKELGVSRSSVSYWEKGSRAFPLRRIGHLARALQTTPEYFLACPSPTVNDGH